jgi:TIR domain-containing protein
MAFKCACFISYPHNAGKSVDKFVARLKEELEDRFAQFVTDPVRTDHDFPTGANFNKAIAQTICESACLLVVYMPVYQRKPFCLQEYAAMEQLQGKRYDALQQDLSAKFGMILPLVYTGEEEKIPEWISKHINYKNISKFTTSDPVTVFDQQEFKEWLVKIANLVDSLYNAFDAAHTNPCQTCGTYALPDEQDPNVTVKLNTKPPTESFR